MQDLDDNGTICMLPWVHLFALQDGRTYPCCWSDWDHDLGSLHQQRLGEIWNGQHMRQLRKDMQAGIPSPVCKKCYDTEAGSMESLRQWSLMRYAHHSHVISETAADGSAPLRMVHLDMRWSNLCNLSCRMCGPVSSSSWYEEAEHLDQRRPLARHLRLDATGQLWRDLEPLLTGVETARFAGGEPLLMPEHYRLLDHWIAAGHTDLHIKYSTNFTRFDFKQRNLFDLWQQFPRITVNASLDADGPRGEYLRHGLVWADVVANRRRMQQAVPHVRFTLSPTMTLFNALQICAFHRSWVEQQLINVDDIDINLLWSPPYLSMRVLPQRLKEQVAQQVSAHVAWLQSRSAAARTKDQFLRFVDHMHSDDWQYLKERLQSVTAALDKSRDQDVREIFPELQELWS